MEKNDKALTLTKKKIHEWHKLPEFSSGYFDAEISDI